MKMKYKLIVLILSVIFANVAIAQTYFLVGGLIVKVDGIDPVVIPITTGEPFNDYELCSRAKDEIIKHRVEIGDNELKIIKASHLTCVQRNH